MIHMAELWRSGFWIPVAGAVGGLLNGLVSDNRFFWPRRLAADAPRNIMVPGLALNVLVGGVVATGVFRAFTDGVSLSDAPQNAPLTVGIAFILGSLAARWMTSETDKRILRAALLRACAAPAAHPDTVKAIASAPPQAALQAANDLAPRFHGLP
jgi:hypothetical protein